MIKGVKIPLGSNTSRAIAAYSVEDIKLPEHTAISGSAGLDSLEEQFGMLYHQSQIANIPLETK